jgi:hypothetical protein
MRGDADAEQRTQDDCRFCRSKTHAERGAAGRRFIVTGAERGFLTDKQPALLYQNNVVNGNVDPNTFDTVGRFYFGRITLKF